MSPKDREFSESDVREAESSPARQSLQRNLDSGSAVHKRQSWFSTTQGFMHRGTSWAKSFFDNTGGAEKLSSGEHHCLPDAFDASATGIRSNPSEPRSSRRIFSLSAKGTVTSVRQHITHSFRDRRKHGRTPSDSIPADSAVPNTPKPSGNAPEADADRMANCDEERREGWPNSRTGGIRGLARSGSTLGSRLLAKGAKTSTPSPTKDAAGIAAPSSPSTISVQAPVLSVDLGPISLFRSRREPPSKMRNSEYSIPRPYLSDHDSSSSRACANTVNEDHSLASGLRRDRNQPAIIADPLCSHPHVLVRGINALAPPPKTASGTALSLAMDDNVTASEDKNCADSSGSLDTVIRKPTKESSVVKECSGSAHHTQPETTEQHQSEEKPNDVTVHLRLENRQVRVGAPDLNHYGTRKGGWVDTDPDICEVLQTPPLFGSPRSRLDPEHHKDVVSTNTYTPVVSIRDESVSKHRINRTIGGCQKFWSSTKESTAAENLLESDIEKNLHRCGYDGFTTAQGKQQLHKKANDHNGNSPVRSDSDSRGSNSPTRTSIDRTRQWSKNLEHELGQIGRVDSGRFYGMANHMRSLTRPTAEPESTHVATRASKPGRGDPFDTVAPTLTALKHARSEYYGKPLGLKIKHRHTHTCIGESVVHKT